MDVRLAVAVAGGGGETVTDLCVRLGISRQTFYVYRRRYANEQLAGLVPRSRAPLTHPNQVPVDVEDVLVTWRKELSERGLDCGARSVWAWMTRAGGDPPSARTIHRVFVRRGLVDPQPQKRPRSSLDSFEARLPNGIWQIDGMVWRLSDDSPACVIRVLDDRSRKSLASVVASSETGPAAWACVQAAMRRFGPPAMLLSDNSLAFTGKRRGVRVEMNRRLADLGVAQVSATEHHPQTCGKAEREHQTLQLWLRARPAADTIAGLHRLIDAYDDVYNAQRPHQGLGGLSTPDEVYASLPKAVAADHPIPADQRITQVRVSDRGVVCAGGALIHIGREWESATVAVIRQGNHVAVFHNGALILSRDVDPNRRYQASGLPKGRPRGLKRLPRVTATSQPNPKVRSAMT